MPPRKIDFTTLDFDENKQSVKEFLKNQTEFSDFDFEGSGISILLDLLTLNSTKTAVLGSFLGNEMFLCSSQLRNSVVSHAKHIDYLPGSRRAATAEVTLTINNVVLSPAPQTINIPKNLKFTTQVNGINFNFVNVDSETAIQTSTPGVYEKLKLKIKEGTLLTFNFTVDQSIANQRFIIPNPGIDTDTLKVTVQTSVGDSSTQIFTRADDINRLSGDNKVFFLQENEDGKFEIFFGDGIIGQKLNDGNIIKTEYLVTAGPDANKAENFITQANIGGSSNIIISTTNPANSGSEREDIESIRFRAPKSFEAQNRAVTVQDYKTLIPKNFPVIDSIAVWGGEDNDPPIFGKVFISIKPKNGFVISNTTKEDIKFEIIKKINVVGILPELIDPEFLFLLIDTKIKFDSRATTNGANDIGSLVKTTINNFASTTLNKFDLFFRFSNLVCAIDNSDDSITGNLTTVRIQKRFEPTLSIKAKYVLKYQNPIISKTLESTSFIFSTTAQGSHTAFFEDDGNGTIIIFTTISSDKIILDDNAGSIDYINGIITINDFIPIGIPTNNGTNGKEIRMTVNPVENDIFPVRNLIIEVEDNDIKPTVILDRSTISGTII